MGLLNTISGALSNAKDGGSGSADLMQIVSGLLSQPQIGGLQGLVSAFTEKGLGDVVSSWVGKGSNLPISGEQIMSVLEGPLAAVAQSTGQTPNQLASLMSEHLPAWVDKLTPDGVLPEGGLSNKLGALRGLLSS